MLCEGQKESCCGAREKFKGAGPKTEAERRVENLRGPLLSLILTLAACHNSKPVRSQHIETCT